MKKIIALCLTVGCIVGLLTSCNAKNNKAAISFSLDASGNYTGFSNVPTNYSAEDANSPYFTDLLFNNGYYYLFDSSSDNQEKQPFLYLLTLEGRFGIPLRDSGVVVLTNDNTLTFDAVMKTMYSSSTDYIQSVSPYKLVMFQY